MIVKRCVNCMEDISSLSGLLCPHCGFDNSEAQKIQTPYAMRQNTIIHGRYLVGKVLGQGGFGITYIGFDLVLNVKVAIKEYFPMGMAAREQSRSNTLIWSPTQVNTQQRQDGYDNFLKEARKTAKIDSIPSIVRVRDTFLENETAYIIMDFVEGATLKDRLSKSGAMPVSECIELLSPMMEGLAKVHKMGIIHRDISPDNIMIQPDGSVKLLDLGAAKDMSSGQGQSQLVTKKGFSPLEQYAESGQIGPWTDVYALCATIYYCITGKMIPAAIDRMSNETISFPANLKEPLSSPIEAALRAGLAIDARNRIQSVDELLTRLKGGKPDAVTAPDTLKTKILNKKRFLIGAGGAAAVLAIGIFALFGSGGETDQKDDPVPESSVSVEPEPVADTVTVERLGTSNVNLVNYGGDAEFENEYKYFIGGDNALYVCTYDQEHQTFYLYESEKACDYGSYITLSDTDVYFLTTIEETNAVCRMDKDGSNMEQLYPVSDGRDFGYLQYVKFSDQREYLYFILENETDSGWGGLYRYDLETREVETVIDGELTWYNLYEDAIYYTELFAEDNFYLRLAKTGLDGGDCEELDSGKDFYSGFIAEDTLYLESLRDEAFMACELDGTPKSGYEAFYNLDIDLNCSLGYGDGWIYYTGAEDQCIHRVRANGTGDSVFLEGHSAIYICYRDGWLWFVEGQETEKNHQYKNQVYYVSKYGENLIDAGDADYSWGLETAYAADFQYTQSEDGDGIMITGYTGNLTSFEIPDRIGGKAVTGIAESAFSESSVEEIGLPEGLKVIEDQAFYTCTDLTFAGLPEGLESIGFAAFGNCSQLKEIDLPDSLTEIGQLAFAETSLSQVYIPANVENIESGAFAVLYDAGLTEFTVSEDNQAYFTYNGCLYDIVGEKKYLVLSACPSGSSGVMELLDNSVGINPFAFAHCRGLTQIVVPESVVLIKQNAFFDVSISEITVNSNCSLPDKLGSDITVNYY